MFFDHHLGNKFSQQDRLLELKVGGSKDPQNPTWAEDAFKMELSLDFFMGLQSGNFPFYSLELYRANVNELKI